MTLDEVNYEPIDDVALAAGLGLILLGAAVIGVFEALVGSIHLTARVPGLGVVILHTSFDPHVRAYIIALGFLILFLWGISRMARTLAG